MHTSRGTGSISSLIQDCLKRLGQITKSHRLEEYQSQVLSELWSDELGRLRVWTANLGAHQAGQSSLDYRLREASHLKSQILRVLGRLQRTIQDLEDFLQDIGPRGEFSSESEDSEDEQQTEIQSIYHSLHDTVNILFENAVSVRRPAHHDRIIGVKRSEISRFEQWDRRHVAEKFPHLQHTIRDRLGLAISQRRATFKYRERHHLKLAQVLDSVEDTTLSETVAPNATPDPNKNDHFELLSTTSQTSYGTSIISGEEGMAVPPPPKGSLNGMYFNCPYCFLLIKIKDRHSWTQHIFHDLMPYICVFVDCRTPHRLYESRREWSAHLQTQHSIADEAGSFIKCPLCNMSINSAKIFEKHLSRHLQELALFSLPRSCTEEDRNPYVSIDSKDLERTSEQIGLDEFEDTEILTRLKNDQEIQPSDSSNSIKIQAKSDNASKVLKTSDNSTVVATRGRNWQLDNPTTIDQDEFKPELMIQMDHGNRMGNLIPKDRGAKGKERKQERHHESEKPLNENFQDRDKRLAAWKMGILEKDSQIEEFQSASPSSATGLDLDTNDKSEYLSSPISRDQIEVTSTRITRQAAEETEAKEAARAPAILEDGFRQRNHSRIHWAESPQKEPEARLPDGRAEGNSWAAGAYRRAVSPRKDIALAKELTKGDHDPGGQDILSHEERHQNEITSSSQVPRSTSKSRSRRESSAHPYQYQGAAHYYNGPVYHQQIPTPVDRYPPSMEYPPPMYGRPPMPDMIPPSPRLNAPRHALGYEEYNRPTGRTNRSHSYQSPRGYHQDSRLMTMSTNEMSSMGPPGLYHPQIPYNSYGPGGPTPPSSDYYAPSTYTGSVTGHTGPELSLPMEYGHERSPSQTREQSRPRGSIYGPLMMEPDDVFAQEAQELVPLERFSFREPRGSHSPKPTQPRDEDYYCDYSRMPPPPPPVSKSRTAPKIIQGKRPEGTRKSQTQTVQPNPSAPQRRISRATADHVAEFMDMSDVSDALPGPAYRRSSREARQEEKKTSLIIDGIKLGFQEEDVHGKTINIRSDASGGFHLSLGGNPNRQSKDSSPAGSSYPAKTSTASRRESVEDVRRTRDDRRVE